MRAFIRILVWAAIAMAAFHAAYLSAKLSFLMVLYLFALLQLARTDGWRAAFYPGLAVGLVDAALGLSFFWKIFSGGAVTLWVIYAFWVGLFVALARLCLVQFGPRWGWVLAPFVWTGLEYFRSELYYLRFSWLNVGYAFSGAPWQGVLRFTGVYGLGFLLAGLAGGGAAIWSKSRFYSLSLLSLGAGSICLVGVLSRPAALPRSAVELRVAGVQMEFPGETEMRLRLNELVRREPDTQLVVLSEYTLDGPVPEWMKAWCRDRRRYLIVGGKDPAGRASFYDTAFVVGPDGRIVFRQAKAVPIQFIKDGLPAAEQRLWKSPWGKIGICVCYDLSYTRVTDQLVKLGAEAIIVPTMDVMEWGLAQHELHARIAPVRATEYGLPIFRVASSGISQLVDCTGQVRAAAPCPGDGAIIAGTLEMRGGGRRPADRWLTPLAVAVTAVLVTHFLLHRFSRLRGGQPPAEGFAGPTC
jgi:apolipoprotein N-acyltransferase